MAYPAEHRHAAHEMHHHHSHAKDSRHGGGHHLLQVEDLTISFRRYEKQNGRRDIVHADRQTINAVRNLNISVHAGEIVAVVGASGAGKTLMADAIMGMFEPNSFVSGCIWFKGERQDAQTLAALRGHEIALVPQSIASLDPLMRVGHQVRGAALSREDAKRRIKRQQELFERYRLDKEVEQLYPHELSGGMARRVLLCCALMDKPDLIIADEPTPGLDLALAARALEDLRLFTDDGGSVLLITHDIELALQIADRIAVFRNGTVVEETSVTSFKRGDLRTNFARALWQALPEQGFRVVDYA